MNPINQEHIEAAQFEINNKKQKEFEKISDITKNKFTEEKVKELTERESFYILFYNAFVNGGYGYNVAPHQPDYEYDEITRKKISKSQQGLQKKKNKTNKYIGVFKSGLRFNCELKKDGILYKRSFNNETKAAIAYDKISLYLYGEDARLNFENKREKHLKSDLAKFFEFFKIRPHLYTSKYNGVYYSEYKKNWVAHLRTGDLNFSINCKNELECAIKYDLLCLKHNLKIFTLNFPDKLDEYKKIDIDKALIREYKPKKPKFKKKEYYVVYDKNRDRFRLRYTLDGKACNKDFKTKERAEKYASKVIIC